MESVLEAFAAGETIRCKGRPEWFFKSPWSIEGLPMFSYSKEACLNLFALEAVSFSAFWGHLFFNHKDFEVLK